MRVPARCVLAGVAFVSALLGAVGAARAERVIALLEIEGARDEDLRKGIGKLITDEVRIISAKTYERAAKRLHAEKLNTGDVRKVCDYLETDGVIDGTLVAEDDGYKLVLRLREGSSGRIAWRQRITLKTPALGTKLKPELKRRLMREIEDLEAIGASRTAAADPEDEDADDEAEDEPPRRKTKAQLRAERRAAKKAERERKRDEAIEARERKREEAAEAKERRRQATAETAAAAAAEREEARAEEEERRARKKRKASREDEADDDDEPRAVDVDDKDDDEGERRAKGGDDEDDEGEDEDDDKKKVASADDEEDGEDKADEDPLLTKGFEDGRGGADPRERAVILNLGASVIARRLKFTYDTTLPENQEPLPYKGSPVPGIYLAGEIYPAAFGAGPSSIVKNIGIGFVFDRVFKLNSRIEAVDGSELATVSTTQQRFGASLRYRHNFGTGNAAPTLYGFVGYNRSQFELAKDEVEEMIAIPNTTYSYIDPGLGVRMGIGEAFGVLAEARALAVLDAGEIQEPEQYGAATITGFDTDLMIEYWFTPNILARIGGHMMYLGYDFKENTGTLQDPDSDMEIDVGGARDVWFGGFLTVGYAY